MIDTIVKSVLNWIAMSVLMPIGVWLMDYWKIKKENKEMKIEIEALKKASTLKDKIDASNNIP